MLTRTKYNCTEPLRGLKRGRKIHLQRTAVKMVDVYDARRVKQRCSDKSHMLRGCMDRRRANNRKERRGMMHGPCKKINDMGKDAADA